MTFAAVVFGFSAASIAIAAAMVGGVIVAAATRMINRYR